MFGKKEKEGRKEAVVSSQEKDQTGQLVWQSAVALEKARFELLKEIERERLNFQHEYAERRMKLLKENQGEMEWMLEALSDLRQERVKFQKKALPEIAEALKDSKVPDEIVNEWLTTIANTYHRDLTLAQDMIAADVESVDDALFSQIKTKAEERFEKLVHKEMLRGSAEQRDFKEETDKTNVKTGT